SSSTAAKIRRAPGAWPSGKATGFGPVIPGSNPGAPANHSPEPELADELAAVVMAGGLGTRMKSATPKHLHPLLGRRMVDWVITAAGDAGIDRVVVVTSPETASSFDGLEVAVQQQAVGTGDAVRAARSALDGTAADVVVLNGDVPGLDPHVLRDLVDTHRREAAAGTVLSFEPDDVRSY